MITISIVIPIIRPEKAEKLISSLTSGLIDFGEFGDQFPKFVDTNADVIIEIVSAEDKDRIGCPKMVKQLVEKSSGELICFLGDDTLPRKGWLQIALESMATLPDGWGLVGLKTEGTKDFAHWLADKRLLDIIPDGEFFSSEYQHCFCDDELSDIAIENNRAIVTDKIIFDHDHPGNGGDDDEYYQNSYSHEVFFSDKKKYFIRKRERTGGKLAIGFPLVDQNVPVQFFLSYACMDKHSEYILLTPKLPHGPWTGSIADARNSIVEQALDEGASHLLMMDTDQVYPHDTLTKLFSHNVDICGVRVHRRYDPFDPIFYRGELGKYLSVPDEEAYSGELIEVDATGTGCLLFNMSIFDDIRPPWFKFDFHEGKQVGEDIYFCTKAKEAGKKIFVDTSIEVGHLATFEVGKGHHMWSKLIKQKRMEAMTNE